MLYDNDNNSQIDKLWSIGLLREDADMCFVPLNIEEEFEAWGRVDVIVQKMQRLVPLYTEPEGQRKLA